MNHDGYHVVLSTILYVLSPLVRPQAGLDALNQMSGSADMFGGVAAATAAGWSAPHENGSVHCNNGSGASIIVMFMGSGGGTASAFGSRLTSDFIRGSAVPTGQR